MEIKLSKLDPKYSDIPDKYYINDFRKISDFKKSTFNGYQKSDVLSALQKSIQDQKLQESCHWAVEMLVSGHYMECWDRLILINSKLINQSNPNLPFYLWSRFSQIIQIIQDQSYQGEKSLTLRNNQECRNHLIDIVTIMTYSSKNKIKTLPKISSEDFRIDIFENKLEAKNLFLIDKLIKENDPSEIHVVVNEFAHQLTQRNGNLDKSLYWLNWILEWERLNVKSENGFNCAIRNRKYIKPQYYHDIIWLIWDVIFQEATFRGDEKLNKQLIGLFKLFKYNFTSPGKRRKSPLIIHAILLISNHHHIKWDTPLTLNTIIHIQANANTNFLYLEYKKKCMSSYQKKEDALHVLTRNNYLVSDQKITPESSSSSSKQAKNKISADMSQRLNMLNSIDKIMVNKSAVQEQPKSDFVFNPYMSPNPQTSSSFQNTEQTLRHIQSFIQ
jgi:uncharacterized protein YqfB (UPF0267 family)